MRFRDADTPLYIAIACMAVGWVSEAVGWTFGTRTGVFLWVHVASSTLLAVATVYGVGTVVRVKRRERRWRAMENRIQRAYWEKAGLPPPDS